MDLARRSRVAPVSRRARGRRLVACAVAGGALVAVARAAPAQDSDAERTYADGIVAVVEDEPITRHELELSCRLVSQYRSLSDEKARHEVRSRQLDLLIEERVLVQRAEAEEVTLSPKDESRLQVELARAAEPYRGVEGLREALGEIGVPLDYFIERKRTNVLISKLLLRNISRDIFITPEQIRRFYREHQGRYEHRGEVRFRQIVVAPDPEEAYRAPPLVEEALAEGGEWDPRAYAESLRERALAGEPFAELAREGSMGPKFDVEEVFESTDRVARALVPPLPGTLEDLEVGEVSPVVESRRGLLHLLLLTERREPGVRPLAAVQDEIEEELKDEVWQSRLRDWIEELEDEAYIRKFLPPPG